MATKRFDFKDIRAIICMQGYHLDYQYYIREIGFWSRTLSGVIPLNCKIYNSELSSNNQQTIFYSEEIHGLKWKKTFENGIPFSDLKCVLNCIYHLTKSEDYDSSYIAICKDDAISGLLGKAKLSKYVVDIENLELFRRNNIVFPTNEVIHEQITSNISKYPVCHLHDSLKNNAVPLCSRSKAKFIADFCLHIISTEFEVSSKNKMASLLH
jgi:hypothetical protein